MSLANCYEQVTVSHFFVSISVDAFSQKCLIGFSSNFIWINEVFKSQKLAESSFSGKFSVWGKRLEIPSKFNSLMWLFNPKMLHNNVLYVFVKAACFSKPGS